MKKYIVMIIIIIFLLFLYLIKNYNLRFIYLGTKKYIIKPSKECLINNLECLDYIMKKYNFFYWLGEGTALGAIRNNDIIKNDTDIDIGIYNTDLDFFLKKIMPELYKIGFKIGRKKPFSIFRNNCYIDIDITGIGLPCMAIQYPKKCDYHINDLKPFSKAYISNKEYIVPNIKYIEKLYGKNWSIPSNERPIDILTKTKILKARNFLYTTS
jgi:hypothetical protein